MFDINDYYLGVILAHPSYFRNPESRMRCVGNAENNPFQLLSFEQAIVIGEATLLRKKGDKYYDEYYSRYKNELCYQEKRTNRFGITLAYQKPFLDYCLEETKIFDQESLFFDEEMVEDAVTRSYYVVQSKLRDEYNVVINDEDVFSYVKEDYLTELLGEEVFDRMVQKSKKR